MKAVSLILVLLLAILSVVAFENWTEAEKLRRMNEVLQREIQRLREQIDAANAKQTATSSAEVEQQRKNSEELLRLRSEVTQLRSKAAEAAKPPADNLLSSPAFLAAVAVLENRPGEDVLVAPEEYPRDSWKFSGYATPEATLVSAIWAMREGNPRAYLDSLSPDEAARQTKLWGDKSEPDIAAKHQQDVSAITGFQIMSSQNISADEVHMNVFVAGPDKLEQVSIVRNGSDWKFAGFVAPPK